MKVKAQPEGYATLTPYLYFSGATEAIEFYAKAFGAKERMRMPGPDGTIGHAELEIGDSVLMMADLPASSPKVLNGTTVSFMLYVADADNAVQRAVDAGAKVTRPLENKFYGDRAGTVVDPFGHEWTLGTHIEDVSPEEMEKRVAAMASYSLSAFSLSAPTFGYTRRRGHAVVRAASRYGLASVRLCGMHSRRRLRSVLRSLRSFAVHQPGTSQAVTSRRAGRGRCG